uniref:Uncharacterized protein n=1 Tax=Arundo donax TaxID=35708 RepID=A0A0A8Z9E9_ARUDO
MRISKHRINTLPEQSPTNKQRKVKGEGRSRSSTGQPEKSSNKSSKYALPFSLFSLLVLAFLKTDFLIPFVTSVPSFPCLKPLSFCFQARKQSD